MSDASRFSGRRAAVLENQRLHVVVLEGGGHVAAIVDKATGVSPLWVPPWPSIEPSSYGPDHHARYGAGADGRLLAGIMGHNLCLDFFGGPSAAEAAAGLTAHGEASVVTYELAREAGDLVARASLPLAQLEVERRLTLADRHLRVRERVRNLTAIDRPIGWTQHVTLGPPFLEPGRTRVAATATRSRTHETTFGPADLLRPAADFDWPLAPRLDGASEDRGQLPAAVPASAYTAHLMDASRPCAGVSAWSPGCGLSFTALWRPADFPWLGLWDEYHSRPQPPWNGVTLTRGLEFGVSPFPESRRAMVDRGRLFGVPTFRWLDAGGEARVDYWFTLAPADGPATAWSWPDA